MEYFTLREAVSNAIKFWEPRRIVYNLVLAAIVIGHMVYFLKTLAVIRSSMSFDGVLGLFLLAVLANVAYCAAYPVDLFAQWSSYRETWLRYRWILFVLGVTFAAILTRFFSMGMFSRPSPN